MKLFSKNSEKRKHSGKKEKGDVTLTYKSLISSFVAMLLCAGLFLGTSFAWFADSQSNTNNVLQTGKMSIALLDSSNQDLSGNNVSIFNSTETPLSPVTGSNEYVSKEFYIKNTGDLNSKYELWIEITKSQSGAELNPASMAWATGRLEDVMKLKVEKNGSAVNKALDGTKTIAETCASCIDTAVIDKNASSENYKITVTMPLDASDIYQGSKLEFSLVVIASQSGSDESEAGTVTIVPSAFQANADNSSVKKIRLYSSEKSGSAMYYCNETGLVRNDENNRLKVIANPSLAAAAVPKVEFGKEDGTVEKCKVDRIDFQDTTVSFNENSEVLRSSFVKTQAAADTIRVICKGNVNFDSCDFNNVTICKKSGVNVTFNNCKVNGQSATPTVEEISG